MSTLNEHLAQNLREQIALEEDLFRIIREQIADMHQSEYSDARALLEETCHVLERHFTPLNQMLSKIEVEVDTLRAFTVGANGADPDVLNSASKENRRISRLLRDDYSALNLVTISNTALHTTALALNSPELAAIALKHLENLAPFVVKIGELMPDVIARELRNDSAAVDSTIARTALKNTQDAWRKKSS